MGGGGKGPALARQDSVEEAVGVVDIPSPGTAADPGLWRVGGRWVAKPFRLRGRGFSWDMADGATVGSLVRSCCDGGGADLTACSMTAITVASS